LDSEVKPVNVAAAALIAQFSIGCVLSVAAFVLTDAEQAKPFWEARVSRSMPWIVGAFSLLTTGVLLFSEPYSNLWKPLLGDLGAPSIQSSTALLIAFLSDILVVFMLTALTGGAFSPFVPVFFILPALAIFLRQGFARVVWYVILISILFSVGFLETYSAPEGPMAGARRNFAYWFVSIACFVLATFIGYVTRPR
jgi:hypothetical protein